MNQTKTKLEKMMSDIIIKQNTSNDLLRCSRIDRISDSARDFLLDNVQDINRSVIDMLKDLMAYIDKNCPKNIQDMAKKINEEVKSTLKACNLTDLDAENEYVIPSYGETSEKWYTLMDKIEKNDIKDIKLDGSSNPMTSVTQSDISAIYGSNSDSTEDDDEDLTILAKDQKTSKIEDKAKKTNKAKAKRSKKTLSKNVNKRLISK